MSEPETTELLLRVARGDKQAEADLWPRVYGELRLMAARQLRTERPDHTLQTTALVHEAYLRLTKENPTECKSRTHFFALAARIMRRVLVDYARERRAGKRGGGNVNLPLEDSLAISGDQCAMLADLDEALVRLEKRNARQARIVEMRFFGGLKEEEMADLLELDSRTIRRDWVVARAWLYGELSKK
jgi:RNA polymerase sigma-70 factor (ECF subfamily)